MSLDAVPSEMGWGEAIGHAQLLSADPSSALAAAIAGWDHPVSREVLVLMDLFDLEYAKTGAKNRKPYQRPYKVAGHDKRRMGNTGGRTREQVIEILRRHGHGVTPASTE